MKKFFKEIKEGSKDSLIKSFEVSGSYVKKLKIVFIRRNEMNFVKSIAVSLLFFTSLVYSLPSYSGLPGHWACYQEDFDQCCDERPYGLCYNENKRNYVFKILTLEQWEDMKLKGYFLGSKDDIRDGFMHLATGYQLDYVIKNYFKNVEIVILGISGPVLGDNLKWENGYPHLYNAPLKLEDIKGYL